MKILVVVIAIFLSSCALHRKTEIVEIPNHCMMTECGDFCCNDDGKICPTCWVGIRH